MFFRFADDDSATRGESFGEFEAFYEGWIFVDGAEGSPDEATAEAERGGGDV